MIKIALQLMNPTKFKTKANWPRNCLEKVTSSKNLANIELSFQTSGAALFLNDGTSKIKFTSNSYGKGRNCVRTLMKL